MKKTIIALSLVLTFGLSIQTADAFSSKYAHFWEELFGKYSSHFSGQKTTKQKLNTVNYDNFSRDFNKKRTLKRSWRTHLTRKTRTASLLATLTSIAPTKDIYEITNSPVNIFKLGVKNSGKSSSSKLPTSVLLDKAEFQLFSKNGIFQENSRDFLLIVNDDKEFQFDSNGKVTLQFNNARLAEGGSLDLNIAIKVDDPNQVPHTNGSTKLRLVKITAYQENSRDFIPVIVRGNRVSKRISYKPNPVVTGGGSSTIVSTSGSSIYGDIVLAGEEKFVLATSFNAAYDDLAIRKITVRNNLTGNLIDSQIDSIQLINLSTGELLKTSRFTNGEARFLLSPRVIVGRGNRTKLGFKIFVRKNPRNNGDRRFKLELFPADVVVESMSNGNELPDSHKNFNVDSKTFVIMESKLEVAPSTSQPNDILIGTGSPERAYEFNISNNSRDSAELGRISLNVYPNGLDFHGGGISVDDFELVKLYGNNVESVATNISISGSKVTFDFINPESFYQNYTGKFGLNIALDESGTSNNNDGVSVQLLGDSGYINNNLAGVRGSGANFIWSDESASPHSANSNDWFSGYKAKIPSNSVFIKR
jgi:hypothetical protein